MILKATISAVRGGFSYERGQITATDWPDFSARLEQAVRILSHENPDSIVIRMDRPNPPAQEEG